MPRFFFDFRQAGTRTPDCQGIEFETVEQAYLEAVKGAQEMWGELLRKRQDPRRCIFEVRSEDDQLLFTVPFQEVLDACAVDREPVALHKTFEQVRDTFNAALRAREGLRAEVTKTYSRLEESRALLAVKI